MPDPFSYLEALFAAAGASAIFVLALGWAGGSVDASRRSSACLLGVGLGAAAGYRVLQLPLAWPPANGLDRFVFLVLPAVMTLELLAGRAEMPRWIAWSSRIGMAAVMGRVLWHGSIYATGQGSEWSARQASLALAICGGILAAEWGLLAWLHSRSPGVSIPLVLSQAILCAGMLVMLAGYVRGGESALPPAGALVGASLASTCVAKQSPAPGLVGVGVATLFGLLFIGRFFGGLSTERALLVLSAPLLCWATEAPALRGQRPWRIAALRLTLTAIPLVAVLVLAKRDFDRDMAPLLERPAPSAEVDLMSRTPLEFGFDR